MALQVWLPLNGDLKNKGCADVTVVNNDATVDNNGKIGKCYSFTPNSAHAGQKITINENISQLDINDGQSFSLACWIMQTDTNYSNGSGLITSNQYKARGIGLYIKTDRRFDFMMCSADSEVEWIPNNAQINMNQWYHICATYDSETKTQKFYLNGEFCSQNIVSIDYVIYNSSILIGQGTQGGWAYTFPGKINDVRIYNHCLSPKEIKEISQGLILHYKLDDPYIESTINLGGTSANYSNTNEGQAYTASSWGGDAGTVTYYKSGGYNNGPYKVYHKTATGSGGIYRKTANDIVIESGKTYTMSIYVKASRDYTDSTYSFNINRSEATEYSAGNRYITVSTSVHFTTEWQRIIKTFTATDADAGNYGEMSIIYNDVETDYYVYFSCFQIEEKDHATPYVNGNRTNTLVIDSSGYGNNGTITGNLTISDNTLRYDSSTLFNGIDSCITIPYKQINPSGIFTMNLWFKKDSLGSKNYETLFGGPSGFEMDTRANNASTLSLYMASTRGGSVFSPFNFGEWYMVTMVRDGINEMYYINGELKKTIEAKSMPNGTYFIGAWQTEVKQNYFGNISDFRIYATSLSADDILQLYQVSAKIDNLGNIHEYELIEEANSQPKVLKTGEIKSNKFVELYNFLYLPAGSFVASGLTYANNDVCKAETVIRYASGGSGRDLMGYSGSDGGYWGVTANGAWEPHGTFSYTNSDITVPNLISYQFSSDTEHGEYRIGALGSSYTVRNKYIYNVKLYKNGILERDLYPAKSGSSIGLFDIKNGQFHAANNSNATLGQDDETYIAKFYPEHIKGTQFIEI